MSVKSIIKNILPYGISNYYIKKNIFIRMREEIPTSTEPPVFNDKGHKLKTIYLKDYRSRAWPYSFVANRYPLHIFYDRFNYGLLNHIYSHDEILNVSGRPVKKFAFLLESEIVDPATYSLFNKHSGLVKEFDLIFTHSASLLNKYGNAVFIPGGGVYYGTQIHGGIINNEQYKLKTKNISIVSSSKVLCDLHKLRLGLARHYRDNSRVNTYGNFDGGQYIKISDSLKDYRYSIIVENDITPYRFTEKILNCFASMTIPIYIGASNIGKFFNSNGIIQINELNINAVDKAIEDCDEKDYTMRTTAIIDNFNRVQDYLCIEDYIWKNYHQFFI